MSHQVVLFLNILYLDKTFTAVTTSLPRQSQLLVYVIPSTVVLIILLVAVAIAVTFIIIVVRIKKKKSKATCTFS